MNAVSQQNWHVLDSDQVLQALEVDTAEGLPSEEARDRLKAHGKNRLPEKPPRSSWLLFLDQFKGALVLVLFGAAILAAVVGDAKDAVVILVVVLVNAILGFIQEHRAERSLAALKKMLAPEAEVRRDGTSRMVSADELVPGDIVLLDAGDRVPADGRVLAAHGLEVDESSLSGESHTVGKHPAALADPAKVLAERVNMLYLNTVVTRGRGEMVVTGTGPQTEMGRIATMLAESEKVRTPLQVQLDALGKRLAVIASIVIVIMLAQNLLRGEPLVAMVMTAISLAVAAIPEGLPAVVTVTLALGLHRMARRRALVKRLAAVETLGCTSTICTDKTGTLTLNQMTARALHVRGHDLPVSGEGYEANGTIDNLEEVDLEPLLLTACLCNDAHIRAGQVIGDPMEGALKVLATKGGVDADTVIDRMPRVAEVPFDSAHKFMATFHLEGDRVRLFAKGAPDVLLDRSSRYLAQEGERHLDAESRALLAAANEALAGGGLRVLGVAVSALPAAGFDPAGDLMARVSELTYVGHIGLMDPPRAEVRDAIRLCRQAGIQVRMITGDQKITAAAIARELQIKGEAVTSAELIAMDDASLLDRIDAIGVFARVTPEQKVRLVKAMRSRGHVVAMTGDGVNDAPALKSADIGVAMGITGTDVAKESATMVLTDDNFATIVSAVEEGRAIYDNIVKFVRFQLSTNFGALLSVFSAPFLGLPLPFNPIQILWVNIIMDGPPAMALGSDPARPGIMSEPPRPRNARILTLGRTAHLAAFGVVMAAGTLGLLRWATHHGQAEEAATLAFTTFVLFQVFNVFNARFEHRSTFNSHFLRNRWLWMSLVAVLLLQVLVVHWVPAQRVFGTTDLSLNSWLLAVAVAASILVLEEARKLVWRPR
ncbi:MAG: calcium-translocating P-type ATPase, PMCA-type [Planctomycetaceae bacterium]|nr:calcium-translocating P-type ATPase, PMCA-type [Planctomycetaceae bacterium]